jgi:hypothetical protein
MASYSEWLVARVNDITSALEEAEANAGISNPFGDAYAALIADSDMFALMPSQSSKFNSSSGPSATEADVNLIWEFLIANPTVASDLQLAVQVGIDTGQSLGGLSTGGVVGGNKQRWKGRQMYTFANGILVGRDSNLVASFGASLPELGSDVLNFIDGIPFSRGTQTRGVTAFSGDVVISGSLQGNNGVIIIDDVIQLETGVAAPAGIGVDDQGRIHLRQRGDGFFDLIDQTEVFATSAAETARDAAILSSKLWVGSQNTSSSRYGQTLIPNGNFTSLEMKFLNGEYTEVPAGPLSIGTTDSIVGFSETNGETDYGVAWIGEGNSGNGFIMPAIPISEERYKFVIRIVGDSSLQTQANDFVNSGIYFAMFETEDSDLGDASYVYDNTQAPGALVEDGSLIHSSNVSTVIINDSQDGDGYAIDTAQWQVLVYDYAPSDGDNGNGVQWASFGLWTQNYNDDIYIDYIVLVEKPYTNAELSAQFNQTTDAISKESNSLVTDASCDDITKHTALANTTISLSVDGGDQNESPTPSTVTDNAILVETSAVGQSYGGIESQPFNVNSTRYIIGYRLKALTAGVDVQLSVKEYEGNAQSIGGVVISDGTETTTIHDIDSIYADDDNNREPVNTVHTLPQNQWVTLFGDWGITGNTSTGVTGFTSTVSALAPILKIVTDNAQVLVDYVYADTISASFDLVQQYADEVYQDAEGFVTAINDQLMREQGSIIPNASFAMPSNRNSLVPAGWIPYGATSYTDGSGNEYITYDPVATDKSIIVIHDGTCTGVISPAVILATGTDKYSIGVRVKSSGGPQTITVSAVYSTASLDDKTNVSNASSLSTTLTGGTKIQLASQSVSTSYVSILDTWDLTQIQNYTNLRCASIVIEGAADFEVDYVLMTQQACSFDLADGLATAAQNEAIAQAQGYVEGVNNALDQESGSLIGNPGFMKWELNGTGTRQLPKLWKTNQANYQRKVATTEGTGAISVPGESIQNTGQNGAMFWSNNIAAYDTYLTSAAFKIPRGVQYTDENGADQVSTGQYSIAFDLLTLGANSPVNVYIKAHEYDTALDPNDEAYITDQSYSTITPTRTININIIKSTESNDTTAGPSESIPNGQWTGIVGTYTPTSTAKHVSFELFVDGSDNHSLYVDYCALLPQTFSGDLADSLATARADQAAEDAFNEQSYSSGNITGNLVYNGNFKKARSQKTNSPYPDGWVPADYGGGTTPLYTNLQFSTFVIGGIRTGCKIPYTGGTDTIVSRPFPLEADEYRITVKVKKLTGTGGNVYIDVIYYTDDDMPGDDTGDPIDALWPLSDAGTFPSGANIQRTVSSGDHTGAILSKTNLTTTVSTLTTLWEKPENAEWASIRIRTTNAAIVVNSVVVKKKLAGLGLVRGKSYYDIFDGGRLATNSLLSSFTKASSTTQSSNSFPSSVYTLNIGREWALESITEWSFSSTYINISFPETLHFKNNTSTGTTPNWSGVGYIKAGVQSDQINFTGQHRCEDINDSLSNSDIGLIVVSTGRYNNLELVDRPTINESLPIVELASRRNQKSVFGVLSDKEDRNGSPREYSFGNFVSVHDDKEELDRLIINSLGEGAIWVCNINGNLENGDYITSCEIPGYGMLQDDDLLHNYTVAKITQDCNFELDNPHYDCVEFEFEGQTYRKAFVGCTYHCG